MPCADDRHRIANTMQEEGSKAFLRGRFKRAGWNDAYLAALLALC
jgi:hypothetical protein